VADAHHELDELHAGSGVGPFDLIAPIGTGGMARVWAARVRGTTDIVAVKMLLPELAENVEFRKMFFDEARIASRVRHPNVCSTFEMGEQQGLLYLAMEWLDGPSLMRVLRPGREDVSECERIPIRPRIAARIVADACAGLHAAHELVGEDGRPLAVVHRDVSPHNLLMTAGGDVKITDFGVAKALGKSHMTIAGQLKGKLAYMAPEQLIGGTIDRRCDVFALGCVLYEITTGQRPFQGEHDPQVMTAIMMGHYEPPAALVPGYPHALSIIVMRALANEPESRYASADQMREALESYLRTSGPQVGTVQVAALIQERCGAEVEARRASVSNAAANPTAPQQYDRQAPATTWAPNSRPKGAHESGSGAMMIDGRPAASRGALWVVVAALVGASLGVGVLTYVRSAKKARSVAAAAAAASATTSAGADAPLRAPATTTVGLASGAPSGAPVAPPVPSMITIGDPIDPPSAVAASSPRVHLTIKPATAILLVDGIVLPRGTDTIARPQDGATMNVLVRAEKHEDTIVLVDTSTPDEVEVTLTPVARPAAGVGGGAAQTGGGAAQGASGVATGGGTTRPRKDAGPAVIDAPPNPYE
jgi:serine/threonine-protein kinase